LFSSKAELSKLQEENRSLSPLKNAEASNDQGSKGLPVDLNLAHAFQTTEVRQVEINLAEHITYKGTVTNYGVEGRVVLKDGVVSICFDPSLNSDKIKANGCMIIGPSQEYPLQTLIYPKQPRKQPTLVFLAINNLFATLQLITPFIKEKAVFIEESKLFTKLVADCYKDLQTLNNRSIGFPNQKPIYVTQAKLEKELNLSLTNPQQLSGLSGTYLKPVRIKVTPNIVDLSFNVYDGELFNDTGGYNLNVTCECLAHEENKEEAYYYLIASRN
jgi:hypothetical protein